MHPMNETSPLTMVVETFAKPGKEEELRRQMLMLVEPTRKEVGCMHYALHVSVDDPGCFVTYETWASQDLMDRHLQSWYMRAFSKVAGDLLARPVRVLICDRIA